MNRSRSHRTGVAALLTALALSASAPLSAQRSDAAAQVDEIFAAWDTETSPGCAVGVTRAGHTVLERAYGMADLEHGIPNTTETIFEGGSLSKQFTAAAVILLVLDGELSLDDDIRRYVPEVPDYGTPISLRRLMTHTSGLRDWGSVASISGWGRGQRSHDHDDVLDIVSRQSALNFEPGHEYSYSNTGYNLLAIVVTRVSGMPFAEFSRQRIFEPLGMAHTQWRDDYRRLVPGRSSAYSRLPAGGWEINRPIEDVHGNGGILTTVGDLAIWNRALTEGTLGGPELVELMHTKGRLSDGSQIVYAGGLNVGTFLGVPAITHTGSTAGYRAFLGRYPDQQLGVAMICNASNVSTGGTGGRIARIFLGDAITATAGPGRESPVLPGAERYAGLFADPVTGLTKELTVTGGVLRDGSTILEPTARSTELAVAGTERAYRFDADLDGFELVSWQYTRQRYERVYPWIPARDELAQYTGTYRSDDAETTYVVSVEGDELLVWQRPADTRALQPVYADGFLSRGGMIRFRRDSSGRVTALSLSIGRVYDMRFDKLR